MRPTASEAFRGGGRSRKSSSATGNDSYVSASISGSGGLGVSTPSVEELHVPGAASMTYFLADEATLNTAVMTRSSESLASTGAFGVHSLSSNGSSSSNGTRRKGTEGHIESEYWVTTAAEGKAETPGDEHESEEELYEREEAHGDDGDGDDHDLQQVLLTAANQVASASISARGKARQPSASTSPSLGLLKSPRSCDDFSEAASQAVISGGEEEESVLESPPPSSTASPAPRAREKSRMSSTDTMVNPPQFIMPTIKMPSRRPFTTRGKGVGRLKILVAGDSGNALTWTGTLYCTVLTLYLVGIGKSSLIKAIVQSCEDIVHVDPVTVEMPAGRHGRTASVTSSYYTISSRAEGESTHGITEVYASTKPYPHWWSEHEDSKVLRRRKSSTAASETVLERNLCFVDTPGYGSATSVSALFE